MQLQQRKPQMRLQTASQPWTYTLARHRQGSGTQAPRIPLLADPAAAAAVASRDRAGLILQYRRRCSRQRPGGAAARPAATSAPRHLLVALAAALAVSAAATPRVPPAATCGPRQLWRTRIRLFNLSSCCHGIRQQRPLSALLRRLLAAGPFPHVGAAPIVGWVSRRHGSRLHSRQPSPQIFHTRAPGYGGGRPRDAAPRRRGS